MISTIQNLVRATDTAAARLYLALFNERNALLSFLFHSLFRDEREIAQNVINPLERTTVDQFRRFVEYYLHHGYRFVSPAEVIAGLDPHGKYALITFDDGYRNNVHALPILEEYRVPAVFFISAEHVRQNKCFWWDVFYRERLAQGASDRQVYRETVELKTLHTEEIERRLVERFGPDALKPRCDIDRPFTPHELRQFAASPYVHLGNHTANHAILTNYSLDEVRDQVRRGQESIREMTGVTPTAIAYPNGAHDDTIVRACADLGIKLGFTVRPHKTPLPFENGNGHADLMRLGRFCPHAEAPMESQCRTYRSDFLLYGAFRAGYLRLLRGQTAQ
jgi:peptidoglycan/xylan/chitin deacetylase (PgdA/CDA1 family)